MESCVGVIDGPCPVDDGAWHLDGCHWESPLEAFGMSVLGFCGCMDPKGMADQIVDYLAIVARREGELSNWESARAMLYERFPEEWYRLLIQYLVDDKELTEHGGSVGGAWLTDAGKEWLARLRP